MATKKYKEPKEIYKKITEPQVFKEKDVPAVATSWGTRVHLLGEEAFLPARNFELRVQHFIGIKNKDFKEHHVIHSHTRCESFMYVLQGKGVSLIEGKEYPLEPGTVIYMPPNVKHVDRNLSDKEELKVLLGFIPFGNEPNSLGRIEH